MQYASSVATRTAAATLSSDWMSTLDEEAHEWYDNDVRRSSESGFFFLGGASRAFPPPPPQPIHY